jgi:hypothetical protein
MYNINLPEPVNSVDEEDDLGVEEDIVQSSSGFVAASEEIFAIEGRVE